MKRYQFLLQLYASELWETAVRKPATWNAFRCTLLSQSAFFKTDAPPEFEAERRTLGTAWLPSNMPPNLLTG